MNILQYPEEITTDKSTQLHVWNNAAFDVKENLNPATLDSPQIKIDDEIQEIENEIKRLSSRLESLRLEKSKTLVEKRGRIVAAKFMDPKHVKVVVLGEESVKNKIQETPKPKSMMMMRRGLSLGPSEIVRSRKPDVVVTPIAPNQSRRKSCFWKIPEVDDERRKSLSVGVGSRVNSIQGQTQRNAATTNLGGSRKFVKKEDEVLALVHPRKLFKEGEKSVPNKKLLKPGRVVASRYNQSSGNLGSIDAIAKKRLGQPSAIKLPLCESVAGKRLLPENDKDDNGGRCDKRRASSVRVKKRWEIPVEVAVCKSEEEEEEEEKEPLLLSWSSIPDMSNMLLPKIRTLKCSNESPRDSGAAKRVAELTGNRSYFCPDEDVDESVCQVLSFEEEEEDANEEE